VTKQGKSRPDVNLLVTVDVLLADGSAARSAKRLQLSPSAISQTFADCARQRAIRCWPGPDVVSCPHLAHWSYAGPAPYSCKTPTRCFAPPKE
jgi:hypothetical protein